MGCPRSRALGSLGEAPGARRARGGAEGGPVHAAILLTEALAPAPPAFSVLTCKERHGVGISSYAAGSAQRSAPRLALGSVGFFRCLSRSCPAVWPSGFFPAFCVAWGTFHLTNTDFARCKANRARIASLAFPLQYLAKPVQTAGVLAVVLRIVCVCAGCAGSFIKQQDVIRHSMKSLYSLPALFKAGPQADRSRKGCAMNRALMAGPQAQVVVSRKFSRALSVICHAWVCSRCASTCRLRVGGAVHQTAAQPPRPAVSGASARPAARSAQPWQQPSAPRNMHLHNEG